MSATELAIVTALHEIESAIRRLEMADAENNYQVIQILDHVARRLEGMLNGQ